jgi:hypothetical protein
MALMAIMLAVQGGADGHVYMKPELSLSVGYWELGDTWESTIFTYFQVCPLIWCGICYSLGNKFRQPLYTNLPMLSVWGSIFLLYALVLLTGPNKATAFFHVASNAHNGLETESPVWMRYQFPLGCPDASSPEEYNTSVGIGSWRRALPSNCDTIAASVALCGEACSGVAESCVGDSPLCSAVVLGAPTSKADCIAAGSGASSNGKVSKTDAGRRTCKYTEFIAGQRPGRPSPGMTIGLRGSVFVILLLGMTFAFGWELLLNRWFVKPVEWEQSSEMEVWVGGDSGGGSGSDNREQQQQDRVDLAAPLTAGSNV